MRYARSCFSTAEAANELEGPAACSLLKRRKRAFPATAQAQQVEELMCLLWLVKMLCLKQFF
jgi:hypothetical protein